MNSDHDIDDYGGATAGTRNQISAERVLELVAQELSKATLQHGPFPSAHHGHSVILEELEELWEEIRYNEGASEAAVAEAVQVAAMAVRYVLDVAPVAAVLVHRRRID